LTAYPRTTKAKYIFDTSPSIILLEKCQLRSQLLSFAENSALCVPYRVMEEYAKGDKENSKPNLSVFREVFSPIRAELDSELLPFFNYDASSGEIWVISYAHLHPEYYCVIDETFGRNICNLMNIKLTGTIGIINEMKLGGILNIKDLKSIRNTIKASGFYLSKELLQKLDLICQS